MNLTDCKKLTILAPDRYICDDEHVYVGTDEMWSKLPQNFWALNYPFKGQVEVEYMDDGVPSNVFYDSFEDLPFKDCFDWQKLEDVVEAEELSAPEGNVSAAFILGSCRELTLWLLQTSANTSVDLRGEIAAIAVRSVDANQEKLNELGTQLEVLREQALSLVDSALFGFTP